MVRVAQAKAGRRGGRGPSSPSPSPLASPGVPGVAEEEEPGGPGGVDDVWRETWSWDEFNHPYYWGNVLLLCLYPVVRVLHYARLPAGTLAVHALGKWHGLLPWEVNGAAILGATLVRKWRSRANLDDFFGNAVMYGKLATLAMAWNLGKVYFGYLCLILWLGYVVLRPPDYESKAMVTHFTDFTFTSRVMDPERRDVGVAWIVEFWAPWAPHCRAIEPSFAALAVRADGPRLRFGKVNVANFPQLAERFSVSLKGQHRQLPTLIKFVDGRPRLRFPDPAAAAKPGGRPRFTVQEMRLAMEI